MESIINIYTIGVVSYTGSRLFIKTSGQLIEHKCPRTLMLYVCDACLKDNCHTCITLFNDNLGSMHLYIWDFLPLKGKLCSLFPQTWTVMWLVFDWAVLSASVKWISIHVIKLLNSILCILQGWKCQHENRVYNKCRESAAEGSVESRARTQKTNRSR